MARLESNKKMGYYPTPKETLRVIERWINAGYGTNFLDPCCGEGRALSHVSNFRVATWGVELDVERALKSSELLNETIQCSIFDAKITPESMGLLWLNPPYDHAENGERVEMQFLKHSIQWLCDDGILIFIVPELVLEKVQYREWIGQHFYDIAVMRIHQNDYPRFKQIVLFGKKRSKRIAGTGEVISSPPYAHIEDVEIQQYTVSVTEKPEVFESSCCISDDEISRNRFNVLDKIRDLTGQKDKGEIRPLFPLKKGHLVSLITAGYLDGKVYNPDGSFIVVKGYSDRIITTKEENDKQITTHTYSTGIRVIDQKGGTRYDIR
jgi:hypothetical protein